MNDPPTSENARHTLENTKGWISFETVLGVIFLVCAGYYFDDIGEEPFFAISYVIFGLLLYWGVAPFCKIAIRWRTNISSDKALDSGVGQLVRYVGGAILLTAISVASWIDGYPLFAWIGAMITPIYCIAVVARSQALKTQFGVPKSLNKVPIWLAYTTILGSLIFGLGMYLIFSGITGWPAVLGSASIALFGVLAMPTGIAVYEPNERDRGPVEAAIYKVYSPPQSYILFGVLISGMGLLGGFIFVWYAFVSTREGTTFAAVEQLIVLAGAGVILAGGVVMLVHGLKQTRQRTG